ncbi:MAG: dihydrolipoamide acetyltransferase family protein [Candidatus Binataceae bacterium]
MAVEVVMPQMGESVVEGTVTKWLVKEGDVVEEDQPLVEISTDKVDTEIPSPGAGKIAKLFAQEGETVPIGARLAIIEPGEGRSASAKGAALAPAPRSDKAVASAPIVAQVTPTGSAVRPADGARPAKREGARILEAEGHRRFSPVVLKIAEDHSIDLKGIRGTGLGGRVTKRDVLKHLESASVAAISPERSRQDSAATPSRTQPPTPTSAPAFRPPIYEPREGDTVQPFTRRRKIIAEHMVYSKTHAPHVGTVAEVDVTRAIALRENSRAEFERREGFKLTLLPLVVAATVRALKEFPRMNAAVAGDAIVIRKEINLGIAMDTDEGLLVPVIKAAEAMSVTGIARAVEELHRKVADKRITPDELSGGSFTLSNPGREGNLYGFAIINQPQVGILRMGEVKKRPVAVEADGADSIAVRPIMYLALSYDHRVIDGVLGNRFLHRVARLIEEADFKL